MKKLLNILSDNIFCKIFFVTLPLLNEIPVLMPYLNSVVKLGLVLAVLYLAADMITNRQTLRMHFIVPIAVFLFALLMSCLLNIRSPLSSMNIISLFYTVATMLVLFPVSRRKTEDQVRKEFSIINLFLAVSITAISAVSLAMFFAKIQIVYTFNSYVYRLGFNSGRLVGLLRNSIYPTFMIGFFCCLIQLLLNREWGKKSKTADILLLIAALVNFLAFVLQQSKGLRIGFYCSAVMVGLVAAYQYLPAVLAKGRRLHPVLRSSGSVVAGGILSAVAYGLVEGAYTLSKSIVIWFTIAQSEDVTGDHNEIIDDVTDYFERDEISDKYGAMTGRPYVWSKGLSYFLEKPIFGYGTHTLANEVHPYDGSKEQLTHFHNVFVQTLVSCGIVGFIPFVIIVALSVLRVLKALFAPVIRKGFPVLMMSAAMIVFLIVVNMADTTILYMMKHSGYVFFIYLGYILHYCGGESSKLDKPAVMLADWLDAWRKHEK